jgi:hypothetical protein
VCAVCSAVRVLTDVHAVAGVSGVAGVPGLCLCVLAQLQCLALVKVSLVSGVCAGESACSASSNLCMARMQVLLCTVVLVLPGVFGVLVCLVSLAGMLCAGVCCCTSSAWVCEPGVWCFCDCSVLAVQVLTCVSAIPGVLSALAVSGV